MNMLLAYELCLLYGLYNLFSICFLIILSNIHDIWQYKYGGLVKHQGMTLFDNPDLPFVSIIIPAHNEEKVINRCMEAIMKLDYSNYEVIIVNDGSVDQTHLKSLGYLWDHFTQKEAGLLPTKTPHIHYHKLPKNVGKARALNAGLLLAKGEIVVCMDADAIFKYDALRRAMEYFKDPKVSVVAVNNKLISHKATALSILQRFDFISNYRSKKAYDILNAEYIVSGIGAMYRRKDLLAIGGFPTDTMTEDIDTSLLITLLGSKNHRIRYAEDVITFMEPVHTFKELLKQRYRWKFGNMQALFKSRHRLKHSDTHSGWLIWWRIPMAVISEFTVIIEILFFGLMFYISVIIGNGLFVVAAYAVATLLCAMTIYSDDTVTKQERRSLALYVPVMFFLSLLMNIVQFWAFVKSMRSIKRLWEREQGYTWNSPAREGSALVN
jgi:biofilm PGA synthesis N-glycosyltransferase PgaC